MMRWNKLKKESIQILRDKIQIGILLLLLLVEEGKWALLVFPHCDSLDLSADWDGHRLYYSEVSGQAKGLDE